MKYLSKLIMTNCRLEHRFSIMSWGWRHGGMVQCQVVYGKNSVCCHGGMSFWDSVCVLHTESEKNAWKRLKNWSWICYPQSWEFPVSRFLKKILENEVRHSLELIGLPQPHIARTKSTTYITTHHSLKISQEFLRKFSRIYTFILENEWVTGTVILA